MKIDYKNVKMMNSYVLFKRLPNETKSNYLILTESQKYGNIICEVFSVGPGELRSNGEREDMMGLKPGDYILIDPQHGRDLDDGFSYADICEISGIIKGYTMESQVNITAGEYYWDGKLSDNLVLSKEIE